jgi:hypothetical protein
VQSFGCVQSVKLRLIKPQAIFDHLLPGFTGTVLSRPPALRFAFASDRIIMHQFFIPFSQESQLTEH